MKAPTRTAEQAAVLAVVAGASRSDPRFWEWHRIADVLDEVGSALALLQGEWTGFEPDDAMRLHRDATAGGAAEIHAQYETMISKFSEQGYRVVTVTENEYPANLRTIFNRPPFLFVAGGLDSRDRRSIAVVGTRNASPEGLEQARSLGAELGRRRITVVSGMARGIDTAAQSACLDAGGRTVAVMGTGITRTYPAENKELRLRIERHGAVVSQFWPDTPPRPFNFPMRNIVTSGLSIGTVVIEATETSGARNQARRALEHGKRLFLVESLVMEQEWAQRYADRPGAQVVKSVEDIIETLDEVVSPPEQLTLT